MAKTRSPNYPSLDLGAALAAMAPVFKAENRNKMGRLTLAKHLGYNSLNGRALAKMGAVRAYGLIEGSGDEVKVSEDAIVALVAPPGSPDRKAALERSATKSSLFKEIRKEFPTSLPSETNLNFWLVKKGYTPDAAGKAAKNYLETMRLVTEGGASYNASPDADDSESDEAEGADEEVVSPQTGRVPLNKEAPPPPGMRKAVFTLDEGDVTLTFPADMSADGYQELADYLDIFLRKAQRKAKGGPSEEQ